ncbi:MAG: hypothetical protein EPO39_09890 [Candidatus Manganitrophaceae bacterium]|nr:MAG: hypothetical protein EPO39_09890 [Candidatus Manganitrophaceae bacterium]
MALPGPTVRFFSTDPSVVAFGVDCLRIVALGFLFMGRVVMAQAFNGAGDTTTPMLLNFLCFGCLKFRWPTCLSVTRGWPPGWHRHPRRLFHPGDDGGISLSPGKLRTV